MKKTKKGELKGKEILGIKMRKGNDANAATIHDYLRRLVEEVFAEGEGFSGKRPFGNSGWEYDLYQALADAKAIDVQLGKYGEIEDWLDDQDKANKLIFKAIDAL
jgi:hypothetical protein